MEQKVCQHLLVQTINEHTLPITIKCCGCPEVWTLDTMPIPRLVQMVADSGGYELFWEQIHAGIRIVHTIAER